MLTDRDVQNNMDLLQIYKLLCCTKSEQTATVLNLSYQRQASTV